MKVALVSTESIATPPLKYGGVESMVYDLCKGLTEKGIDVTLFACKGSRSPSNKLVEVMEEGWGKTGQSEEFVRRMLDLKAFLQSFDVVHDNSHVKSCWRIHNRTVSTMHWNLDPSHCNYRNIVAISNRLSIQMGLVRGTYTKVIYNGCDLSKYKFKKEKTDRFLFLSAMTESKGADVALSIAKGMNLKMDFAGFGGNVFGMVEQESKVNPNIRYLGEVTEEQKISLYQNAKALIFPTGVHGDWEEPFALVTIEAMSCGTPVITWNSGAMPEVVSHGRTGFVCNSIEELRHAVGSIDTIKNEDCRRHVENNFTYQIMAEKYIELYNKLLNNERW